MDRLRNAVNVFLPIRGVGDKSSLPIIEGSHLWTEAETIRTNLNPKIDNISYSVPAIISMSDNSKIKLKRPIVNMDEVMIFSPYCIHGGAKNLSQCTRISLEFRFKSSL